MSPIIGGRAFTGKGSRFVPSGRRGVRCAHWLLSVNISFPFLWIYKSAFISLLDILSGNTWGNVLLCHNHFNPVSARCLFVLNLKIITVLKCGRKSFSLQIILNHFKLLQYRQAIPNHFVKMMNSIKNFLFWNKNRIAYHRATSQLLLYLIISAYSAFVYS